jgi:hypothetical protein
MSDDMLELIVAIVVPALGGLMGTGWYASQRWLVRKGIQVAMLVVDRLDDEKVKPMKEANHASGLPYDLTRAEGKQVMEEAKQQVLEVARLEDRGLPKFFPSIEKSLKDPAVAERIIEKVVQERKGRKPKGSGKGFA